MIARNRDDPAGAVLVASLLALFGLVATCWSVVMWREPPQVRWGKRGSGPTMSRFARLASGIGFLLFGNGAVVATVWPTTGERLAPVLAMLGLATLVAAATYGAIRR